MKWIGNAAMALGALCLATSAQALETHWSGASGLLPDAVDPRWTLVDEGGGSPSFAGGVLTISTPVNSFSARQFYTMRNEGGTTDLDFSGPAPYWLEAEMRFVSGSQTSGWWRAPGHMSFRFASGNLAVLEIRKDLIYVRNGDNSRGAQVVVDTDDAFHTYRLEALGQGTHSIVNVYYDGNLVMSDDALYSASGVASLSFGEGSTLAGGVTQWRRVAHNMAAVAVPATPVPEPGSAGMALLGGLALWGWRRGRRGPRA
ncbi:PEP-CTERM sorting domain-containing protein [Roseateles sp.]|uniref:PEP-CTERM sorting domain-containing protein n=1 Tax=Roseateles sp. TaxID=1971397 RepID=UPI00394B9091